MKIKQILALIILTTVLFSCGKKEKKNEEQEVGIIEAIGGVKELAETEKVGNALAGFAKVQEKLMKTTPIENAELKKVTPKKVNNYNRSSFSMGEMAVLNIKSIKAVYKEEKIEGNENQGFKEVELSIMDGAGEGGAYMGTSYMRFMNDFEEENEFEKSKTSKFKSYKSIETISMNNNGVYKVSVDFIKDDRFSVAIKAEGSGVSLKDIEDFYDALDLSSLK